MKTTALYCLKVWLTGVVGGAIGLGITESFGSFNALADFFNALIFGSIVGAIFSSPSYLVLWLVSSVIDAYTRLTDEWVKLILTVVGIALAVTPVLYMVSDHDFKVSSKIIALIYAGVIVAGTWFYRLRPGQQRFYGEGDYQSPAL